MTTESTQVDIDAVLAALDALPPGKRHQDSERLEQIVAGARKARARGISWIRIVNELKSHGFAISVGRLQGLAHPELNAQEPAATNEGLPQ